MNAVYIHGCGAVSPAGWGVAPMREALIPSTPLPEKPLSRPGLERPLSVRQVPAPPARPAFQSHARLRRTSPISQFAVAAALEALGEAAPKSGQAPRLGVVMCVMSGCVNYSRRFYDETLRDPATASPLVFPETVFNAPASHLAALLGTTALNYTLVGDPGTFLQGIALAANWVADQSVDSCLVVGAEEMDWLTADAYRLFAREVVLAEGAGALLLSGEPSSAVVRDITSAHLFHDRSSRLAAALRMRAELPPGEPRDWLFDGRLGITKLDRPENKAWNSWPGVRHSPGTVLGEGLMAGAAWQAVAAADAVLRQQCETALISVVGCNQQAIGARFSRHQL